MAYKLLIINAVQIETAEVGFGVRPAAENAGHLKASYGI
jgi:hypothetical protein